MGKDTPSVTAAPPTHPQPLPSRVGPVIRLRGVSARWPGADRDAVTGIDLDLEPGQRTVVVGESGSGKSTLLAVLLGFLPLTEGTIAVDGVPAADIDPDEWRTLFGWCDQQAYLFDSSLAENVRLARPVASDDEVETALRSVGAGDWLVSLPDGLNTRVGEHGLGVSGGERQRIALARAVLSERPVLLADEPAAHLDATTADAVTDGSCGPTRSEPLSWSLTGRPTRSWAMSSSNCPVAGFTAEPKSRHVKTARGTVG